MSTREPFFPHPLFSGDGVDAPQVIISPGRYVQGKGVLDQLGKYLQIVPSSRPAVMMSAGGHDRFGARLKKCFEHHRIDALFELFGGECSYEEVERIAANLRAKPDPADAVIAVGGGKCLDAAKCVAFRLNIPVVICPTIASTDAPCSAVSVMYSREGVGLGPEFFPNNPALVLVDTQLIAESPKRHLVAGMGDALATCYEARTCYRNPRARNMVGGRPTLAALAIAELTAEVLFENGKEAARDAERKVVSESLEKIIEANTLLSGIGFESGGFSIAHAVAAGLTVIPAIHRDYLHGELVGIGVLIQLIMEGNREEAARAAQFMAEVGLPVVLEQLSLDIDKHAYLLREAMAAAVASTLAVSAPFEVTPEGLFSALAESQRVGAEIVKTIGDTAYRRLHQP